MSAIFISHSSKDNDAAGELRERLRSEGHTSYFLDFDPVEGIKAGHSWERAIYTSLRKSQAVVVLLSRHSTTSKWVFAEITQARALGKHLFPIKLDDCQIEGLVSDTQVIDLTKDREEGYARLWQGLRAAGLDPASNFDWDGTRRPYPGLLAFEKEDAAVFFGRENEIRETLDVLKRFRDFGGRRLKVILGPSGSGKSSLLRAGVVPRLERDPDAWIVVGPFRPLDQPFRELAGALAGARRGDGGGEGGGAGRSGEGGSSGDIAGERIGAEDPRTLAGALEAEARDGRVETLLSRLEALRTGSGRSRATVVVALDQVEELLGKAPSGPHARFLLLLRHLAEQGDAPVVVLGTMRSDFLGELQNAPALRGIRPDEILLPPITGQALRDIIEKPAERAGIDLGDGLVDAIVDDMDTDDALPLLAFTLRELWEGYHEDGLLAVEEYRDQLGGLQGAVAGAAKAVFEARLHAGAREEEIRETLLALVRVDQEGKFARRAARWADFDEGPQKHLEAFVGARLLVARGEGPERIVEIAHEAIFRAWDRMRVWLRDDRQFLEWRRRLGESREAWLEVDRDPGSLLQEARLAEAERWREERGGRLDDDEVEYIELSLERRAEHERRRRRRMRQLIGLTTVAGVSAVLALAGAWWANESRQRAVRSEQQANFSLATVLEGEAAAVLDPADPESRQDPQGWLYTLAALDMDIGEASLPVSTGRLLLSPLAQRAFRELWTSPARLPSGVASIALSPDGRWMASGMSDSDGSILLWDMETGQEIAVLTHPPGAVASVAFSPDSRLLASAAAGVVRIWSVASRTLAAILTQHEGSVHTVAFSPDGRLLAVGDESSVRLWSSRGWTPSGDPLRGFGDEVTTLAFSPDGQMLAAGSRDRTVRVWNVERRGFVATPWAVGADPVTRVAFHPDGLRLAVGTDAGAVVIADLDGSSQQRVKGLHPGRVQALAFSPNRSDPKLASASRDGVIRVWDPSSGDSVAGIPAHDDWVEAIAFSRDGETLASGSRDATIRLWDTGTWQSLAGLSGHGSRIAAVAFSPDDSFMASADFDGRVTVWSAATGSAVQTLESGGRPPRGLAFLRDGSLVAAIDTGLVVWSKALPGADGDDERWAGAGRFTRRGHLPMRVRSVAASPSGEELAVGLADGAIRLVRGATGDAVGTVASSSGDSIAPVAISPDRPLVAGIQNGRMLVWDRGGGLPRTLGPGSTPGTALAFGRNGRVASGHGDGTIRIWDAETATVVDSLVGHRGEVRSLSFDPAGRLLVSSSDDGTVRLREIGPEGRGGRSHTIRTEATGRGAVAFSSDGGRLATGSPDGEVRVWDTGLEYEEGTLPGMDVDPFGVAFGRASDPGAAGDGPPADVLFALAASDSLLVWRVDSRAQGTRRGEALLRYGHEQQEFVRAVAFARRGGWLAAGWDDEKVRLWRLDALSDDPRILDAGGIVSGLDFSPDGRYLAAAADTVLVWDVENDARIFAFTGAGADEGSDERLVSVSFSEDGSLLAAGSSVGGIRVWNIRSGDELDPLLGHADEVVAVRFLAGGLLASAGRDRSIRLWDPGSGRSRLLAGHTDEVTSLAAHPGGDVFASGSRDRTVRLWSVRSGLELARISTLSEVASVAVDPGGRLLATGEQPGLPSVGRFVDLGFFNREGLRDRTSADFRALVEASFHRLPYEVRAGRLVSRPRPYLSPLGDFSFPRPRPFMELDSPRPVTMHPIDWILGNPPNRGRR